MTAPRTGDRGAPALRHQVEAAVRALREGEIVTYGEIAAQVGRPGAARAVGAVLRGSGTGLPWWRVVGAGGRLAAPVAAEQARRLRAEGLEVRGGRVRWAPRMGDEEKISSPPASPPMTSTT